MKNNNILNMFRQRLQAPGILTVGVLAMSQTLTLPLVAATTPVENRDTWISSSRAKLQALRMESFRLQATRARNVIFFVGDGMGISTVTAARILEGQEVKQSAYGEENLLSWETFPNVAFSRTYSANQQVSDSAPTMTAMISGVKTNEGVIGIDQSAVNNDHTTYQADPTKPGYNKLVTLLEQAETRGLSTGVVSSARITHATPAACYAHTPSRDWECDNDVKGLSAPAYAANFPDIAKQLINFTVPGNSSGLEIILGGGSDKFLKADSATANRPDSGTSSGGRRLDEDLVAKWKSMNPAGAYVTGLAGLKAVNTASVNKVFGLFNKSHMEYEVDRTAVNGVARPTVFEPSLADMTKTAIEVLRKNRKGYFLHVEAGRIDHGHHAGNAYRALKDTIALSDAVKKAMEMVGPDTRIVVSADHSHVFTMAGYPQRGNDIMGVVMVDGMPSLDLLGLPYSTLGYANGPGYTGKAYSNAAKTTVSQAAGIKAFPHIPSAYDNGATRPNLLASGVDATDSINFMQEATVPLGSETHAGEDVGIWAKGPNAQLFRGSLEQSMIYWIMAQALGLN
jgi:alkaline phosphatase